MHAARAARSFLPLLTNNIASFWRCSCRSGRRFLFITLLLPFFAPSASLRFIITFSRRNSWSSNLVGGQSEALWSSDSEASFFDAVTPSVYTTSIQTVRETGSI